MNNIFWNSVHPSSHSPTSDTVSGSVLMYLCIIGIDKEIAISHKSIREIILDGEYYGNIQINEIDIFRFIDWNGFS